MPTSIITIPGVAQTTITFHTAGHKGNQVWHWFDTANTTWTIPHLQTLADTIMNTYRTQFQSSLSPTVTVNNVQAIDLSSTTPGSAISAPSAWSSIGSGAVNPGLSLMVNFKIPVRYKGGHPRTYFPPFQNGALSTNEDTWITSATNLGVSGMSAIAAAVSSALPTVFHSVVRYTYNVHVDPVTGKVTRTRVPPATQYLVNGYAALPPVRSQRRRNTSGT